MSGDPLGDLGSLIQTSNSAALAKIGSVTITANALEQAASSVSNYLTQMATAIKAKNYGLEAEMTLDEALIIAKDFGIGGIPVGVASVLLPMIFQEINNGTLTLGSLSDNAGERQGQIIEDRFGR